MTANANPAPERISVDVDSFHHSNPIPCATRMGPILVSSIIPSRDPGSNDVPASPEAQIANLFHHAGEILTAAGLDWAHVMRMTFYVADLGHREAINGPWVERFPDAASRPARHTMVVPGGGAMITCDFWAYAG